MIGPKFVLRQDNDPKHTAKVIKNYLQAQRRTRSPGSDDMAPTQP